MLAVAGFHDRREAGRVLAGRLGGYRDRERARGDVLVLGLPRGGVPVAREVADALGAPLDVLVVRKLGVPGHEELAMGAIAEGGVRVLNEDVIRALEIGADELEQAVAAQAEEVARRARRYRDGRPAPQVAGRVVILVDDGLATGATMHAAVLAVRAQGPARVVVAVPVGAHDTCARLLEVADEVVCARVPEPFYAVGLWYQDFAQTTDEEVRALLGVNRQDERSETWAR